MTSNYDVMIICCPILVGKPLHMHRRTAKVCLHTCRHPRQITVCYESTVKFGFSSSCFRTHFHACDIYIYVYIYIYIYIFMNESTELEKKTRLSYKPLSHNRLCCSIQPDNGPFQLIRHNIMQSSGFIINLFPLLKFTMPYYLLGTGESYGPTTQHIC